MWLGMIECMLSKCKAPRSNPRIAKERRKRRGRREEDKGKEKKKHPDVITQSNHY
jgi:hypothetical protein